MVGIIIPDMGTIELPSFYPEFDFYYPTAEILTRRWTVRNVKKDWIVFDCGANIGTYTIMFSKLVPDGKVYAFEPTSTFDMLDKNMKYHNVSNVVLEKLALSNKVGTLKEKIYRVWGPQPPETIVCEFTTIDAYCEKNKIEKLDCIKIDTDGFDFEILMGAKKSLRKFSPVLIMEIYEPTLAMHGHTKEEVFEWLKDEGYDKIELCESANYIASKSGVVR